MKKIVLVTGANKGIGLEICRQLCEHDCTVILTSRNKKRGLEALKTINGDIIFHQLDVEDSNSISELIKFVEDNHNILSRKTDFFKCYEEYYLDSDLYY